MLAKRHKFICGVIAIAFLVVVQWFAAPAPVFRYLIPAFAVYLALVTAYNFFYLQEFSKINWWVLARPVFFLVAWFLLFLVLPTVFLRGAFLLISLPIIYFIEFTLGSVGENILFNLVVLSSFGFYMAVAAAVNYFSHVQFLFFLFLGFIYTVGLSRSSFELIPASLRSKWLYSLTAGLFMAQVFWAVSFLPLHFSALGFFMIDVFYFIWMLSYYFLLNNLTPKKVQFHLVLMLIVLVLIFVSTPWSILVS